MTIPSFDDVEKTINQNFNGIMAYSDLEVKYDFTDVFSELELEPKYPMKIKLLAYFFINNKTGYESKSIEIQVYNKLFKILEIF